MVAHMALPRRRAGMLNPAWRVQLPLAHPLPFPLFPIPAAGVFGPGCNMGSRCFGKHTPKHRGRLAVRFRRCPPGPPNYTSAVPFVRNECPQLAVGRFDGCTEQPAAHPHCAI